MSPHVKLLMLGTGLRWSGQWGAGRFALLSSVISIRRRFLASGKSVQPPRGGQAEASVSIEKIRNVGIMAHIDAGKTTTTERMLFYSGRSRALGDVDDGDTVTDYMEQERARGITITSAAVSFPWLDHRINLIDTPGHVDFTMEVERCLTVLDGAITVLDASAGVEAQSLTVWQQAERHGVPLIVYLNKMDKAKANVAACLNSIREHFRVPPLLTQMPLFQSEERSDRRLFVGAVDLTRMERLQWRTDDDSLGRQFQRRPLQKESELEAFVSAVDARQRLVESTADLDDALADTFLRADGDAQAVTAEQLEAALRRITLSRVGLPVLCGSSRRNVGVQPLLDAVVRYLPSPMDRVHPFAAHYGLELCALAFKVIHDQQRGRLTFLRLYTGEIRSGQKVFNLSRGSVEKLDRVMTTRADNFEEEVASVAAGGIALVSGLRGVVTGDTLVADAASAQRALSSLRGQLTDGDVVRKDAVLAGVAVPPPVFFCSVEPASLRQQKPLELALENLQLEDPSLRVNVDADTGQTIIAGMGELHLDIVKDRLRREYKVDAHLGDLQVAYRESLETAADRRHVLDRTVGDTRHQITVHLSLEPTPDAGRFTSLRLNYTRDNQDNLSRLRDQHRQALENGVAAALAHGPLAGFPLSDVSVGLSWLEVGRGTSLAMVSAAASQCVRQLLIGAAREGNRVRLNEPAMALEVSVPEERLHVVMADLSQRRSQVLRVQARHDGRQLVSALAPLSELLGYSTALRTATSGLAVFSMSFHAYVPMSDHDQQNVIRQIRGQ